jgi:hypothetical protein
MMSEAVQAVSAGHPLMVAWSEYKQTDAFNNTRRWALHERHVDGSLWAAFEEGWRAALQEIPAAVQGGFDLIAHLHRQRTFSAATFGPGARTAGVLDHIRKELGEIENKPYDLYEWVDVILLALDGAWRAGHEPEAIAAAIGLKLTKNESREWPDWRTVPADRAIEHKRSEVGDAAGD